jgi:hypothetical protein
MYLSRVPLVVKTRSRTRLDRVAFPPKKYWVLATLANDGTYHDYSTISRPIAKIFPSVIHHPAAKSN